MGHHQAHAATAFFTAPTRKAAILTADGVGEWATFSTGAGEIKGDGQFDVVWKTDGLVPGDAWSKELDGSKELVADWVTLKCGNYNTKTKACGGAAAAN